MSGVFKTTNGGRTWSAINNGLTAVTVSALAIDPVIPSIVYAAGVAFGSGVYKTTDGGSNWVRRSNGILHTEFISLAI